jgi:hypothetical protein
MSRMELLEKGVAALQAEVKREPSDQHTADDPTAAAMMDLSDQQSSHGKVGFHRNTYGGPVENTKS